jgi:CheY-like chemotaxis protein
MSIAFAQFETATKSELNVRPTRTPSTALLHCLVVAENAERRAFLAESARAAGWEVTAAADAIAANHIANRFRQSLVIVDLDDAKPGISSSFRQFTERLCESSQPLLMICGTEGNALEELWARQLGAWLYLSGVEETCDVKNLCHEAQRVVEKLIPRQRPAFARTA